MSLSDIRYLYNCIGYGCGFFCGSTLIKGGSIKIVVAFATLSFVAFYFKNTTKGE